MAGQWLRKENVPPSKHNGPYLYMFNHVSMFDQFMIGAYIPHYITAVAAIEVLKYPIWGYIIKKYGVIPIVRQKIRRAIGILKLAEEAIKIGANALIEKFLIIVARLICESLFSGFTRFECKKPLVFITRRSGLFNSEICFSKETNEWSSSKSK